MASDIEEEQALKTDIAYALRDAPIPRTRRDKDDRFSTWKSLVAAKIVEHLRMANWIIKRGPPARPSSMSAHGEERKD